MNFFKDKKPYSLDRIEKLVENYTGAINQDKEVKTAITNLESTYERNQSIAGATAGVGAIGIFTVMSVMSPASPFAIELLTTGAVLGGGGVVLAGMNKFYKSHLESVNNKLQENISDFRQEIVSSLEKLGLTQYEANIATKPENVGENNLLNKIKNARRVLNDNIENMNQTDKPKNKL